MKQRYHDYHNNYICIENSLYHPIYTILGYSQWIVTWVFELKSALVHTTAQNHRPLSLRLCTPNKNKHVSMLFSAYRSNAEVETTNSSEVTNKMKEAVQ